jgi:hypothetical protein
MKIITTSKKPTVFPESKVQETVYHGSHNTFDEFKDMTNEELETATLAPKDIHFFSSSKYVAEGYAYASVPAGTSYKGTEKLYEAKVNLKNPKIIDFNGANWKGEYFLVEDKLFGGYLLDENNEPMKFGYESKAVEYAAKEFASQDQYEVVKKVESKKSTDELAIEAKKEGYDGIVIKNINEIGEVANTIAVFDSKNISIIKPDSKQKTNIPIIQLSKTKPEFELNKALEYFKMKTRDVAFNQGLAKGLEARVQAVNKRLGYKALYYKQYYTKDGAPRLQIGIAVNNNSVAEKKTTFRNYSNWFNSLTPEQQKSENALRVQEGMDEIPLQQQKISNRPPETQERANEKVKVLQKIFNVEVEYDTTLDATGAVVPGNRGEKPKILLNPDKLAEDTVIHEFAHIFIDALGGLKNARVNAAVQKLKGTELWAEVEAAYPELYGEDLQKEVLATAMGRRGTEIFNEREQQTWWQRFMDWVHQRLANIFKVDVDYVEQLSVDLFNDNNTNLQLISTDIVQFSKVDKSLSTSMKTQAKLEGTRKSAKVVLDKTLARLKTKRDIINQTHNPTDAYKKYAETLEKEIDTINKYSAASHINGLAEFIRFASNTLANTHKKLLKMKENGESNAVLVNQVNIFSSVFEDIEDAYILVNQHKDDIDIPGVDITVIEDVLKNLSKNKEDVKLEIKRQTRHIAAHDLAINSNYAHRVFQREAELRANELFPMTGDKKQVQKQRDEYVHNEMIKNQPKFYDYNLKYYNEQLETTTADIDGFEMYVLDAQNISSHTVQIVHKMLNDASTRIRQDNRDDRNLIELAAKEFYKVHNNLSPEEMHKNQFTRASDGTYYLTTEYTPDYWVDLVAHNKLHAEYSETYSELTDAERKKHKGLPFEKFDKRNERYSLENGKYYRTINNNKVEIEEDVYITAYKATASMNFKKANSVVSKRDDQGYPVEWRPKDKYRNPKYDKLDAAEKRLLEFSIGTLKRHDKKLHKKDQLGVYIEKMPDYRVFKAPQINASSTEALVDKGFLESTREWLKDKFKKRSDEEEFGELDNIAADKEGIKYVNTYESGERRKDIPVFFRRKAENQSFDLPTLLMMNAATVNNYSNKYALMPTIDNLVRATADKQVGESEGFGLKKLVKSRSTKEAITFSGRESNEYKTLLSIVEDNIFNIKSIDLHTTILGMDANKILSNLGKWTADSMLILNYLSAGANVVQGKTMNFLEAVTGNHLNLKKLKEGEQKFWEDTNGWLKDVGKSNPSSKTSLLMEMFNIKGDYSAISTAFFRNNRAKGLLQHHNLHALNHIGEFYTAGTLMYSILNDIKVMNKDRKWIDKKGKVVATKEEAASLLDSYEVVDNKLKLIHDQPGSMKVAYTSLDIDNPYNEGSISNYLKKIYADLHGQYDPELQSAFQRTAVGKLVMMLRKWMLPGMLRRWRGISTSLQDNVNPQDIYFSQALMTEQEGNYTTTIRFVNNLRQSLTKMKFDANYRMNWDGLTNAEKGNVRRTVVEMSLITLTLVASLLLRNLAKGIDDDETRKRVMLGVFWTRRAYSELSFFMNPQEQIRILRSPAAAVSMIESSLKLLGQVQRDIYHIDEEHGVVWFTPEMYERGPRKGEPKVYKKIEQVTPVIKNVKRDVEDATDYLWNNF